MQPASQTTQLQQTIPACSVLVMTEMTVRQARELLIEWATVVADRDARVRSAFVSGVSKSEIARLTGLARTTVDRITDSMADGPTTAQDPEQRP